MLCFLVLRVQGLGGGDIARASGWSSVLEAGSLPTTGP